MIDFTHLRLHSAYSITDGLLKPSDVISLAKEKGQFAVAITDLNRMLQSVNFYEAARKNGIKPIIGIDAYIEQDLFEINNQSEDEITVDAPRLLLIAKSYEGYKQLMQLSSLAYTENLKNGIAFFKQSWLKEYSSDIIAISGDYQSSEISKILNDNNYYSIMKEKLKTQNTQTTEKEKEIFKKLKNLTDLYKDIFEDRFFLEVQRYDQPEESLYVHAMLRMSAMFKIPLVATHPVQFAKRTDYYAHEIRTSIANGELIDDITRTTNFTREQYFKSTEEMNELFKDLPTVIENTNNIAKMCSYKIPLYQNDLPDYPTPNGESVNDYLEKMAKEGLEEKLIKHFPDEIEREKNRKTYEDRLNYEISVIKKMGFAGYFMIVSDFIKWGKENNVYIGPGRGSGAGSLVAYSLHITDLDPLPYGLLFERFLNPDRISMPDFDIDFDPVEREKVFEYVKNKYNALSGENSVSKIATYSLLKAKVSIKDVGRVLQYNYFETNLLSKLIIDDKQTIAANLEINPELKKVYESSESSRRLLDYAMTLEDLPKTTGVHAGGVIISPTKISDYSPLYVADEEKGLVSQYDKSQIEHAGLVKFDFLGLANLTIIKKVVEELRKNNINIDINNIPLNDPEVYKLFQQGNAIGVFQFESSGMRNMLKAVKPTRFEELIALVSLYRPGPMEFLGDYIDKKNGKKEVEYLDPRLEDILKETYGIMIYQEQVMQVAQKIAGYTLGKADILRRAMGKKEVKVMEEQSSQFIEGAMKNGINKDVAKEIFRQMEAFAGYGFNKSHAAAYSFVSYQTAYLKVKYPEQYYSALYNNQAVEKSKVEKLEELIIDAKMNGMSMLPPDINICNSDFITIGKGKIRFGIAGLKGVSTKALEDIKQELKRNGNFLNIKDFCDRISKYSIKKNVIEQLIKSGSLDSIEPNRILLISNIDNILKYISDKKLNDKKELENIEIEEYNKEILEAKEKGDPIYTISKNGKKIAKRVRKLKVIEDPIFDLKEDKKLTFTSKFFNKLQAEKESIGFYLSESPYDYYNKELDGLNAAVDLDKINDPLLQNGHPYLLAGIITGIRTILTKNGEKMAFITISSDKGSTDVTLFASVLSEYEDKIKEDEFVALNCLIKPPYKEGKKVSVNALDVFTFNEIRDELLKDVVVCVDIGKVDEVKNFIRENRGRNQLIIHKRLENDPDNYLEIALDPNKYGINATSENINKLKTILNDTDNKLVKCSYLRDLPSNYVKKTNTINKKSPKYN